MSNAYNPHIVVRDVTPPYPGPSGSAPTLTPKLSANDALAKGLVALNVKGQLMKQATPELVLYPVGRVGFNMQYALAWRMTLHALNPPGDWDVVVDALTGETLRTYNLRPSPMSRNSPAPNASTSVPKEPSPTSPPRVAQATPIPKTNPTPSKQPESAIIAKPLQPSGTATANVPPRPTRPAPVQSSNGLPLHPDHKIFPGKRISNSVSQQTTLTTTSGWNTLMTEGFEGVWPTGAWWVSADPTWDDESYRPHTGSWSAWCAGSTLNPPTINIPTT